ncbi:MAG: ammonium transporter, partial [Acidimicrobiales bacterium]
WMLADSLLGPRRRATFLGAVNGMICGLVGITPSAGWVDGYGALAVGAICSGIVWVAWHHLPRRWPFSRVDDALGIVYTHGMAGLCGGLLVGILADPGMIEYGSAGRSFAGKGAVAIGGVLYTGSWHQEWEQLLAAAWIVGYTAVMSAVLFSVTKVVCRGLREPDEVLEIGDVAMHGEEAFPAMVAGVRQE